MHLFKIQKVLICIIVDTAKWRCACNELQTSKVHIAACASVLCEYAASIKSQASRDVIPLADGKLKSLFS